MSLNVQVGADVSAFQAGMKQVEAQAKSTSNEVSKSLSDAAMQTDKLGGAALSSSQKMMQMRSGISAARDGVLAFTVGGQAAERSLLAMGHHINSLVNETGSFKGALGALGSSLWGPGGIILGVSVAIELFLKFGKAEKEAYDATKNFTDAKQAESQVINNLDDSYGKAISNVTELTENVKLARQGFINKNEVVKEYNDTLGKTMGAVKTLAEVEQKLIDNGPDYVKMMLYKAAAQTALKEASDKATEAAKIALKPQEDFKPNPFVQFALGNSSAPGSTPGNAPISNAEKQKQIAAIAEQNRATEKNKFEKDQNDLIKIFTDFQDKAAKIAADHNWTFIDPEKEKKAKDAKSLLSQLQKELTDAETALGNSILAGKTSTEDATSPLVRRVNAATEAIRKFKETMAEIVAGVGANNFTIPDELKKIRDDKNVSTLPLTGDVSDLSPNDESAPIGLQDRNDVIDAMQKQINVFDKYRTDKAKSRVDEERYNETLKRQAKAGLEVAGIFGDGLMNAFQQALNGTASFVSAMGTFLLQLIEKLIAAAAAAAILAVLLKATGFGAALGGASSFGSLFGSLSGLSALVPQHASGGIFTQAHVGMFGEAGPEAIVTPKHLQEFAGVSGGNQKIQIEPFQIGAEMWFRQTSRTNKRIGRIS